jgi:hypothetical protein
MVDVVGEKHQQRRVMVVALFTGDLVNTNSGKNFLNTGTAASRDRYMRCCPTTSQDRTSRKN